MTLVARDEGGNVGRSDPIEITLPQQPFVKPIAKALVEQRRDLVLYPESRDRVQTALDALTIAPDLFGTTAPVFLGLVVASDMLEDAQSDTDLVGVRGFSLADGAADRERQPLRCRARSALGGAAVARRLAAQCPAGGNPQADGSPACRDE